MSFQCGIVGLPNVGKSTLFNALTESGIPAENYPFCTIEPHIGIVELPDARLKDLARIYNPEKVTPATVEFIDIAGLVKGASKGEGLGNQFLGQIRQTSAILHVVRCFDDKNITHVDGSIDPVRDVETIETELLLADILTLEKRKHKVEKLARSGEKEAKDSLYILDLLLEHCSDGNAARLLKIDEEYIEFKRFPKVAKTQHRRRRAAFSLSFTKRTRARQREAEESVWNRRSVVFLLFLLVVVI